MKNRNMGGTTGTSTCSTRSRKDNNEFSRHFRGEEVVGRFLERINGQNFRIETYRAKVLSLAHLSDGEICDDDVDLLAGNIHRNRGELGREVKNAYNRGYLEDVIRRVGGKGFAEIIRASHEEGCMGLLLEAIDRAGGYTKATSAAYWGGCLEELLISDEHLKRSIKAVVEEGRPELLNKMARILGFERMIKAADDEGRTMMEANGVMAPVFSAQG